MKQCLKDIGEKAIKAYSETIREQWVLDWPGQIVLSGSQTHWTTEVSAAISKGTQGASVDLILYISAGFDLVSNLLLKKVLVDV